MTEEDEWDEALQQVRAIMSEHFHSWAFVALDEGGDMSYDYTNHVIGEMLFNKAVQDMTSEIDISLFEWDEEPEEGDEWKDGT